jgi:hypothetical protein
MKTHVWGPGLIRISRARAGAWIETAEIRCWRPKRLRSAAATRRAWIETLRFKAL